MNKAIVICYTGQKPDSEIVYGIHQTIESRCNGEGITIKVFDSDSIAEVLLKKATEDVQPSVNDEKVIELARTKAIQLIKSKYSGATGHISLTRDIVMARYHHHTNVIDDDERTLLDAIDVIVGIPQKRLNTLLPKATRDVIFTTRDL